MKALSQGHVEKRASLLGRYIIHPEESRLVRLALLCSVGVVILLGGCGGSGSSTSPPQSVTVTVSSSSSSVLLGNTQQLTATVTGTSNAVVTWSVNGIAGGNPMVGTISSTGLFTAPQDLPTPPNATIQATSVADNSASANTVLTITSDISVNVATHPSGMANVFPGGSVQLVATLVSAGHPDPTVNWAVNGVANGSSALGTITAAGPGAAWYIAPANPPNPASVTITAGVWRTHPSPETCLRQSRIVR